MQIALFSNDKTLSKTFCKVLIVILNYFYLIKKQVAKLGDNHYFSISYNLSKRLVDIKIYPQRKPNEVVYRKIEQNSQYR